MAKADTAPQTLADIVTEMPPTHLTAEQAGQLADFGLRNYVAHHDAAAFRSPGLAAEVQGHDRQALIERSHQHARTKVYATAAQLLDKFSRRDDGKPWLVHFTEEYETTLNKR